MFWSGNYIAVRELNFLLKEENVTLTQVLEADDILQECKADNKALMQFLTKPKILAELITLITEEPPKNVELASQYRHASIACEVLTSHLSMLSDRLSMDTVQMNRLCDFINRDPPLNPLLASYFSKTIEMLLERSPKQASPGSRKGADLSKVPVLMLPKVLRTLCFAQDWYLYHILCLRVLDFFKSRRDFLPNLLRHISTSAIADTFKYFIRLDDLFNKIIMEWFEEHQLLECLIQIICGTYAPEPPAEAADAAGRAQPSPERPEKGQLEPSEKHPLQDAGDLHDGGTESPESNDTSPQESRKPPAPAAGAGVGVGVGVGAGVGVESGAEAEGAGGAAARRVAAVASANAAALLCDLILSGCAGEGCNTRPRTSWALVSRLMGAGGVRLVLQGMFTAPPHARAHALVNGAHVLRALLDQEPILGGECSSERSSVELAVAPHLPLLHQALLQPPPPPPAPPAAPPGVGLPRVQVAALLAHLAVSEVEEVAATMLTLGTPGVVVDMMFAHENNNFLHAQAYALVKHALANKVYRTQYARHLLVECDLLTRLMDAFEENENKKSGSARSAYMGHVVLMLRRVAKALDDGCVPLDAPVAARWDAFRAQALAAALHRHDTPLGGCCPSENIYEFIDVTATASLDDLPSDIGADAYNEMCSANDPDYLAYKLDIDDADKGDESKNNFLEIAVSRFDDYDEWEDSPEADGEAEGADDENAPALGRVRELLGQDSPWESSGCSAFAGGSDAAEGAVADAGWAQFDALPAAPAAPDAPAAPCDGPAPDTAEAFAAFWPYSNAEDTQAWESGGCGTGGDGEGAVADAGRPQYDGTAPDTAEAFAASCLYSDDAVGAPAAAPAAQTTDGFAPDTAEAFTSWLCGDREGEAETQAAAWSPRPAPAADNPAPDTAEAFASFCLYSDDAAPCSALPAQTTDGFAPDTAEAFTSWLCGDRETADSAEPQAATPWPARPAPAAGDPAPDPAESFAGFWLRGDAGDAQENSSQQQLEANIRSLELNSDLEKLDDASSVELANKLLTAMSGMAPEDVADIVGCVPVQIHGQTDRDGRTDSRSDYSTSENGQSEADKSCDTSLDVKSEEAPAETREPEQTQVEDCRPPSPEASPAADDASS